MIGELKPYPLTKDSGVAWLGNVPTHWEVRRLGQIGNFSKGKGGSKEDEAPQGIPCVRYGDLYTTHQYFIRSSRSFVSDETAKAYTAIKFGDVLFAASGETIGEIGKSATNLLRSEARCGGDVILFRPHRKIEARYLGYAAACRPAAVQKATMGRGITIIHIYPHQLKRLGVALPPLSEQTAIARFLDHADRRIQRYIRTKESVITLLEEQKQTIIHQAVTGQIDVRTGQRYPAYKPSGVEWLCDVPAHWKILCLGRVISLKVGFPFKSGGFTQSETDIRLLRGINVAPGRMRWDDVVRWSADDVGSFSEYQVEVGDVILGMDRPIVGSGIRVAVVAESDLPALLLQRVARIRPRDQITQEFVYQILNSRSFLNYLSPIFTGISVPHLSPEQISKFRIALPSITEQLDIAQYLTSRVSAIQATAERAEKQIGLLREFRTRLIADVVSGKLDVRAAAATLPEVDPFTLDDEADDSPDRGGVPAFDHGDQLTEVTG